MANSFLQSLEWEKFQNALGRETFRIRGLLFIRMTLPLNKTYLSCPRFNLQNNNFVDVIQKAIDQANGSDIFIRFEPEQTFKIDRKLSTHKSPCMQPKQTLVLDLTKTDDQLLLEMKPKTRYNIRLAKKKEIRIEKIEFTASKDDPADRLEKIRYFDEVWKLMQETSKRDKFSLHFKNYYLKMLEVLSENDNISLLTAKHENDLLAAMILIIYKDQAIYLHGASSNQKRNLMATYLLHWEAIKLAKNKECKTYDFWGINLSSDILDGVTKFKLGFGGVIVEYPASFEIPIQKSAYLGYRATRKIHRLIKPRIFQ